MRLLFSEGTEVADIDPTAAEHQRSSQEKESEQDEQQSESPSGSESEDAFFSHHRGGIKH
jgi:hypothetical protein